MLNNAISNTRNYPLAQIQMLVKAKQRDAESNDADSYVTQDVQSIQHPSHSAIESCIVEKVGKAYSYDHVRHGRDDPNPAVYPDEKRDTTCQLMLASPHRSKREAHVCRYESRCDRQDRTYDAEENAKEIVGIPRVPIR